jgi:uncharacterized protein
LISSELALTEVPRGLRSTYEEEPDFNLAASLMKAEIVLEDIALHPIECGCLRRAGRVFHPRLRSLDAIHVMTALELRPIEAFMSYDKRQIEAARRAGLPIVSPGA